MNIPEYVNSLTSVQLDRLMHLAQIRKNEIQSEGFVILYGVFGGVKTQWFEHKADADEAFMSAAKESLNTKHPEVSMEPRKVELNELAEYLGKQKSKTIIEQGWLVVKPNKVGE